MQPKIEAAMQFVLNCGGRSVITSLEDIEQAVAGKAGTEIIQGSLELPDSELKG
jgi:carbamate kinase